MNKTDYHAKAILIAQQFANIHLNLLDRNSFEPPAWAIDALENTIEFLDMEINDKQAKIDALMLEYCPDEMTQEQILDWSNNQQCIIRENEVLV